MVLPARLSQEGPPPGGFGPVQYARDLPRKGISSVAFLGVVTGLSLYGFIQYAIKIRPENRIRRARIDERMDFLPKAMREYELRQQSLLFTRGQMLPPADPNARPLHKQTGCPVLGFFGLSFKSRGS
jgi:hypothetical protein